jgi:L-threonylcarbamoyladenylate synthase
MAQPECDIAGAVRVLAGGGLVAFPTETVYGLGADATNAAAVRMIFVAKGRPPTNPLIVHVADESIARRYVADWPLVAQRLAQKFWPGPLTLVVPKANSIVAEVTAGRETVGLRVPAHPTALQMLIAFGGAVAAPSANRAGKVSPTTAQHVRKELGDQVDLILDAGPCLVGIESTVLDVTSAKPVILRPGQVSREQIEKVIGPVDIFSGSVPAQQAAGSPGMQNAHYSPKAPMFRFESGQWDLLAAWCGGNPNKSAVILVPTREKDHPILQKVVSGTHQIVEMPNEAAAYARALYAALHAADDQGTSTIWVLIPPNQPAWLAIRDRLIRASINP